MNENRYLRLEIDVCVFEGADTKVIRQIVREGKGQWGTGEKLAREFMEQIRAGDVEIDEVRNVEVH